jgi:hypothetical protein
MLSAPGLPSGMLGQIRLVQQDLARTRNDLTAALAQVHARMADLDDRLKASVAAECETSARSNQQATSSLSCQLAYNSSLTALVPTMSASASPYASVSPSLLHRRLRRGATHHQALMFPGMGSTSPMYAASGNRGAVDTPAANQGPLGRTFTCVFYNLHIHFHFQSSVTNDFLILLL